MLIGGFQKSSLLDYRNKIAAIVFTVGCNFSCPYCHNPELVLNGTYNASSEDSIIEFLKTRINKLDGVVITGGEPTLQKDLPEFIKKIKAFGFLIKLDTNGTNPLMLEKLLSDNLLDYVAMDIKAPFDEYEKITRKQTDINNIKKSMELIINNAPDYEFRTTVVSNLLNYNSFVKINNIFKTTNGVKRYYLQKFQKSKHIDETFLNAKTFDDDTFDKIEILFKDTVKEYGLR